MNFQNYLEVIKNEEITNKIINLNIFKKGEKLEKKFNANNSFYQKAWDKTYSEIQNVWTEIQKLDKNENELKLKELKDKLKKLKIKEKIEFKKGKPYLINTDFIVGETENSWLIENLVDENQTAIYLSKKWAPNLTERGILNYDQIKNMKNNNEKQEFIIFLHPEKSVSIYQNGCYIGNSFLSKMIWFFESISGIWHKFKIYWSKESIQKRKIIKERILSARKRFPNSILANKILLENSRKENSIKSINNKFNLYKFKKETYLNEEKEECKINHKNMDEERNCKKIHIFK